MKKEKSVTKIIGSVEEVEFSSSIKRGLLTMYLISCDMHFGLISKSPHP